MRRASPPARTSPNEPPRAEGPELLTDARAVILRHFPAATWFELYVTRNGSQYLDLWIPGATNWTPSADLSDPNRNLRIQDRAEIGEGQVGGGGDRKKFGEAFDDAENGGFQQQ